jgi:ATP-dependent Clp protease ATP-binding subunit ClpA
MSTPAPDPTPSTRNAFASAEHAASTLGQSWAGCEHLLLALIQRGGRVAAGLAKLGVTLDAVLWGVIELGGGDGTLRPMRTVRLVRAVRTAERLAREAGRPQADDVDLLFGLVRESVGAARALLGAAADEVALRHALGDR